MRSKSTFLLICFCFILAKAEVRFRATVKDSITLEPLGGAFVVPNGLANGTKTSPKGDFQLTFAKEGEYSISISYVGYKTKIAKISAISGDSASTILLSIDEHLLDEVTVSVSRTKSTIENIPTKIELIGQEDLKEEAGIKPGNILSLLGDVGGIQLQQVSASSGNTFARIQGLNGRYTQILKDGLPMFGGLSSNLSIMQIPPLDLKQIEIIKGCGSTLYGGDAIGGIINLVSKNPSNSLDFVVNQTSLNETNLNLYIGKKMRKFGYTIFVGQTRQFEKDIDSDGLSDVPNINSFVFHPKFVFNFNRKSTLTLNYTTTLDKRIGGNMRYFSTNDLNLYHIRNDEQRNTGDLKWLYQISDNENLSAKASYSTLDNTLDTKNYTFKANQKILFSEISYSKNLDRSEWIGGLNINGDIFENLSETSLSLNNYAYKTIGLFAQNNWECTDKLTIESGFREDYHSKFGLFALPRLAILYKFNQHFTFRLNGGVGYKVPIVISYIEPETDLNNISIPVKLRSEISEGLNTDFNFQHYFGNNLSLILNQSLFFTNLSNPVVDISPTLSTTTLINADKPIQTLGAHTYARLRYDDLELYLGYVYTNVKQTFDQIHPRPITTPMQNLSTTLVYEANDHFRMGIESSLIVNQLDQSYKRTKDYLLCALMFQYNYKHLSFVLNGENLLDFRQNRYERIFDGSIDNPEFHPLWAPIDGRVINISIKWSLNN